MSYPITDIEGIQADSAATLKSVGIRTTAKLLEAAKNPKGRKVLASKTGYDEAQILRWANLADTKSTPVEVSLALLDNLHDRWTRLLRSLNDSDFASTFRHPDHGVRTLDWMLFLYVWHGKHHTAHITNLRRSHNW